MYCNPGLNAMTAVMISDVLREVVRITRGMDFIYDKALCYYNDSKRVIAQFKIRICQKYTYIIFICHTCEKLISSI